MFKYLFFVAASIMMLDWLLTLIWLPIGVSRTYGFQSASFFTTYYNGTGAPTGWNWLLSFLFTSGVLTGFDASGHVAEVRCGIACRVILQCLTFGLYSQETKSASITAARGIFWSCVASGVLGTPIIFLFLACSPPLDVLFSYDAPQPFVILYQQALGKGGQMVMTTVAILGLWMNIAVCLVAASRLAFAIARDGILPGSTWIGKADATGGPRHAVIFVGSIAAFLLCFILPSPGKCRCPLYSNDPSLSRDSCLQLPSQAWSAPERFRPSLPTPSSQLFV